MNNIAIAGYGTIGRGVATLLKNPQIQSKGVLRRIFDLPSKKADLGSLYCGDIEALVEDPQIDTIFECLGGDELPYRLISGALKKGKNVITSNKETIARHLQEYLLDAKENHGTLQFEASCGGGIPLLYPLLVASSFDEATSILGILNGTSNFILTRMGEGQDFMTSLKSAQEKGFAEKDPTADLEGLDLLRKAVILSDVVYKKEAALEAIPHFGIAHLEASFIDFAKKKKEALRFVVDIHPYRGALSIVIMPTLFPEKHPFSAILEETNAVQVVYKNNGPLSFIGKGAGQLPTASAMIADYLRVASKTVYPFEGPLRRVEVVPDFEGAYWVVDGRKEIHKVVNPTLEELRSFAFVAKERTSL
jgi:homoserine dehydrogenase